MDDENRLTLEGTISSDVQYKELDNGFIRSSFVLQNNRSFTWNNEEKTEMSFFCCDMYTKDKPVIPEKGSRVTVHGRLKQSRWKTKDENHNKIYVLVEDVT